jgi:hypothetical protein
VDEWGAICSPVLPPINGELLRASDNRFFERLSGNPVTFSSNTKGDVTGLSLHFHGNETFFAKVSNEPPKTPEPLHPRVATSLDSSLLDACVGQYEFAPIADLPTGMKLFIRRDGDHLTGRAEGKSVIQGEFAIYPQSETEFFIKVDGALLNFIKNDQGEVTSVTHHQAGLPDMEGKKLKN